jgi:hypothetical protein
MEQESGIWACFANTSWAASLRPIGVWFLGLPWLELTKTVFDLIKGIAWPLMILWVVLLFRKQVADLIPRIVRLGKDGVEVSPAARLQTLAGQTPSEAEELAKARFAQAPTPQFIKDLETDIWNQLETNPNEEKLPLAVRAIAYARTAVRCERTYGLIFGSQIRGLRELINPTKPVTVDDAKTYYEENVKVAHTSFYKDFPFEAWLGFLVSQELVEVEDGLIRISDFGRWFLGYMNDMRLPEKNA